ncbi:MAG: enoyl-CoA hydratase/isomerase family protein [Rhodospirillaceae bacterium]|nr:enoyl-CoA hydratase/isomerase family protein [Rhodospirillaceae bacterium]
MSLTSFVPTPEFAEYKELFSEHFVLERDEAGVIVARAHTRGGPVQMGVELHRAFGQLFRTLGSDPNNEVMIFTGTGPTFMMNADTESFRIEREQPAYWSYEHAFKDGRVNLISLIHDMEIPTIGAINGPTVHSELLLMCDITICTPETVLIDPHFVMGAVPGDGIHSCFIELLGVKRAAYALLMGQKIDAQQALDWGMVNEVVPADRLLDRAREIAAHIMKQPRVVRRMTAQVLRRPWKQRIVDDLDGAFAMEMQAHLAKGTSIHSDEQAADVLDDVAGDRKDGVAED